MTNPVLSAIADRRSIRAYTDQPVTKEQLDALLKAAMESPSARNAQPWHFTVVQSKEILEQVNQESARQMDRDYRDLFYAAPLAIFISCTTEGKWGRLDSGIAAQTIALAAHSMGLGSVILGLPDAAFAGEKADYFKQLLKFPEGHEFAIALAIGTPSATKDAHPNEPNRIDFV